MVKIGKEITFDEFRNKISLNEINNENHTENAFYYSLFSPSCQDYYPGTIILLEKGEKLSSIINKIDINIEKLGITHYRERNKQCPVNLEDDPIDFNNVKFEIFPNLKVIDIQWTSVGINNDTFNQCKNIEILSLSTPLDYPFDTDNCSSLYTLTNLKILNVSGYGMPKLGKGFFKFAQEGYANKKFQYNFFI